MSNQGQWPERFAEYRDLHRGASILVCGCGTSLGLLERPGRYLTIGVNDVGRRFSPDYLVVVNERRQFDRDRYEHVERTRAKVVFTQLEHLRLPHSRVVRFRLGRRGGTDRADPESLHYSNNSPYVAVNLARHLGAKRIGLIGVDFGDDHFFGTTGQHPLAGQLPQIDREYAALAEACRAEDVELFNLSPTSRLQSLPRACLGDWPHDERPFAHRARGRLRIVSYATTPVAGVPAILARCIAARTEHEARCVWAFDGYPNVKFAGDVQWSRQPKEALGLLESADLVIVHNGKVDAVHRRLLKNKPVVVMAHNYGWNVDMRLVERGFPGVVVGQYQATLPEFAGWQIVPNPMPLWEPEYLPGDKGEVIGIAYTPSGQHERYPVGHRMYWHSKGFRTTMQVLERLARRVRLRIETTAHGKVAHAQALAMKRRAHIVIDECVTGSYHRNSLEGLATGCVVVNGVGALAAVVDAARRCAPEADRTPFVQSSLECLEDVISTLVANGARALAMEGCRNRKWMERHWDFSHQWSQYWTPTLDRALSVDLKRVGRTHSHDKRRRVAVPVLDAPVRTNGCKCGDPAVRAAARDGPAVANREETRNGRSRGVSVVVPHGGRDRLPHLAASLANLAGHAGVTDVIVVEIGKSPDAVAIAQRWGAKYVFVHNGDTFERARALNVGSHLATCDLVLWKDNDLLLPSAFVERAAAELRDRRLDHLLPYYSIRYLSARDSQVVIAGQQAPERCRPDKVLRGGRQSTGGAALVTSSFLSEHGGIPDGFRGWGGEDNAWFHKAQLLGRSAVTAHSNQQLFHLYHANSGAHRGSPIVSNPHYRENVSLLAQLSSARCAEEYTRRFPDTGRRVCPWERNRRVLVIYEPDAAEFAHLTVRGLRRLYDIEAQAILSAGDFWNGRMLDPGSGAVIVFADSIARALLADPEFGFLWGRTIVGTTKEGEWSNDARLLLARAGAVAASDKALITTLRRHGRVPTFAFDRAPGDNGAGVVESLVQPLSLVMAYGERCAPVGAASRSPKPINNIFACLVHESQECVIDLVRNLQYQDPGSVVLLYDGSGDSGLLDKRFPFERHGAVICPSAGPMQWGYLHTFALDCMRFALNNFDFDTVTIVDSDQLAMRTGYSEHLGDYLFGKDNVGMLGNAPERQQRTSKIAPAVPAWQEFELWRPFLRGLPGGEESFLHWTFWPSTVFTRDAARELQGLFTQDEQLRSIMTRTRIWATEEIILPTLVAALGFEIHKNPCSPDYVRHREVYTPAQVDAALRRTDVFWMHPIPRQYHDPLRTRVRIACGHYSKHATEVGPMNYSLKEQPHVLLTTSILQTMRRVEGWLEDDEADLLIVAASRALAGLPSDHAMVEIGSFCGRSTVVLGSVLKALSPSSRLYAIDPHDGKVGALDQGIKTCAPTLEKLKRNLANAAVADVVEIVQKCSYEVVDWHHLISLLLIDGLHDYANVARDFYAFEDWIAPGGYIAFHDYATYYPGVMSFVDELLNSSGYRKIHIQRSLALVQRVRL